MVDGIRNANNFVIIGTTNKVETLDEALLRPGRLSHAFRVGYPDWAGRKQIWEIHLRSLLQAGIADRAIVDELADLSEGFTGAMIQGSIQQAIHLQRKADKVNNRNLAGVVQNAIDLSNKLRDGTFRVPRECFLEAIKILKNAKATGAAKKEVDKEDKQNESVIKT